MADVVADTNVVIWYFVSPKELSAAAEIAVDSAAASGTIYVSPITIIELIYLIEKRKIQKDVLGLLLDALDDPATGFRLIEIGRQIAEHLSEISRSIVADMSDRIIAATALHLGVPMITSDLSIRQLKNIQTIW